MLDPNAVARFRASLTALAGDDSALRFGLAVSGGPDSLALLLLAHAALPGRIEAATFDHGLRDESAAEAEQVTAICRDLGVSHGILRRNADKHARGTQKAAREWRYAALGRWLREQGLGWLLTAHHADDQAETVLMRLSRGAGIAGLSGIRPSRPLDDGGMLARPLLGFTKTELVAIVEAAGLTAVDDPSNRNPAYDRTQARSLLESTDWLESRRIGMAADNLRAADEGLVWAAEREWQARARADADGLLLDPAGLPSEILRRLVARAVEHVGKSSEIKADGQELTRFIAALAAGRKATLGGVVGQGGPFWRFATAPPRRDASAAAPRKKG